MPTLLQRARRKAGTHRRFAALTILTAFVITRIIAVTAISVGGQHEHDRYRDAWKLRVDDLHDTEPPPEALNPFIRWDALFYVDIAREGYPAPRAEPVFHAAFFPLYPLTVRALTAVIPNTFVAALLLSNACALAAAFVLYALARQFGTRRSALAAALLFLCAPGSHFLSLPYTEALFALVCGLALLGVSSGNLLLAAIAGALTTATRSAGVVVGATIAIRAWQERRSLPRSARWLLTGAATAAGLLAFAWFCHQQYGDALYFSHVMAHWGRAFSVLGPVKAFLAFNVDPDQYLMAIAVLAVGVVMLKRRDDPQQSLGAWLLILLPLSTGMLKGVIRYESVNLPLLGGAGRWLARRGLFPVLAISLLLMAYEAFRYGAGYANH